MIEVAVYNPVLSHLILAAAVLHTDVFASNSKLATASRQLFREVNC